MTQFGYEPERNHYELFFNFFGNYCLFGINYLFPIICLETFMAEHGHGTETQN